MRDLYGLVIAEFGSGPLDVAPLNEPVSHAFVRSFPITANNGLNLRKQNAAQEAILLCGRWLFVFGCCVCVCHMFSSPRTKKSWSGLLRGRSSAGPTFGSRNYDDP